MQNQKITIKIGKVEVQGPEECLTKMMYLAKKIAKEEEEKQEGKRKNFTKELKDEK